MFEVMTGPLSKDASNAVWGWLEPFSQLFRAMMPRAATIAVYNAAGRMRWSNDSTMGPDLTSRVDAMLPVAHDRGSGDGTLELLGEQPAYLFWLRAEDGTLLAVVAVLTRPAPNETEPRGFSFTHSLLRPALECLRRELLAMHTIDGLKSSIGELDGDLDLLLADAADANMAPDGADELKTLLQRMVGHLKCMVAALIVPEKGIALVRGASDSKTDGQLIARAHRQLLQIANANAHPVILNDTHNGPLASVISCRALVCPVRSGAGRGMGVLALLRDPVVQEFTARDGRVAEILARRAAVVVAGHYDALSGLYTRSAFEQRVRAIVAERTLSSAPWSALYVNCDRLHVINDNHGMHVGDTVIGQLGELIRGRLPPGALAARISGDRFTVLLPTELDDASRFAESLRVGAEMLSALHPGQDISITISIGVAPLENGRGGELAHSLAAAETACKAAKDRGRNRVATYEAADQSVMRRFSDIDVVTRVREALTHDRMLLVAQPIAPFKISASKPAHFELLLRMIGRDGSALGPDTFLSAAVRYQMMADIDRWVLTRAIHLLKPYADALQSRPCVFSINFSGQSLGDDEFPEFLFDSVQKSGINPKVFCFELTENATILNLSRAEVVMRRLRRMGCEVALDDFGTGLCSLSYLRQLPVTMLKIDGSFVRDVMRDPRADSMVQVIAQLARTMSLDTVAEYVETDEIRDRIAQHGVDYAQGYAIGRAESFEELLKTLPQLNGGTPAACTPAGEVAATLAVGSG
ncbi:MAG TPA: bifunctional diguanylate cyclase/phosphodiesterase [Steroidobacteraceae bacterium]|nr:bifunctional diguanylate cyclase/phosphodiesterase [Steroidobacteraceae bacterium]